MSIARRTATILVGVVVVAGCGGDGESSSLDEDELEASVAPVADPTTADPTDDAPTAGGEDDPGEESTPTAADPADPGAACTVAEDESRIEVVSPRPGDELASTTFRLAGCGNTFEATYLWEFELDDGDVAGSGFGTMTCGSGCVGTFDEEITVDAPGPGVLRVFEEDAQAGDRVNVVEVPVSVADG